MVVSKTLNEDRTSKEVLQKSGFLEKLKRPGSDSSLMIAYMPQKDNPVGIATLRDERTINIKNSRAQEAKARIIEQLHEIDPESVGTRVIVTDLWPTLFVSLLMQESVSGLACLLRFRSELVCML